MANGEFIPKWRYNNLADAARIDYDSIEKIAKLENKLERIKTFLKHEVI